MKKTITLLFLSAGLLMAASCKRNVKEGKGPSATEPRTVSAFTEVEVSTSVKAMIKIDPTAAASVTLTGYKNVLEDITTEVVNGKLVIDKKELIHFNLDKDIIANITVPSIKALTIKGAADADLQGTITESFNLRVSGAGDVVIANIIAPDLTTTLSGAGSLEINGGTVNTASYKVSGAGDISAFPLQTKQAKAHVSGAGDVEITALEKLDVTINGAGEVSYKGHPTVSSEINGVGSLEEAN